MELLRRILMLGLLGLGLVLSVLPTKIFAQSQWTTGENVWKDQTASYAFYQAPTPEEACKLINVGLISSLYYTGDDYVSNKTVSTSGNNDPLSGECKDNDGQTYAIIRYCVTGTPASFSLLPGKCPEPELFQCVAKVVPKDSAGPPKSGVGGAEGGATKVGNPTDIRTGTKYEYVSDWSSTKDQRFRIMRNYRSNMDHITDLAQGYSSVGAPEFAGLWRLEFAELLFSDFDWDRYIYKSSDGSRIHFDYERYGTTSGVPISSGHPFRLERIDNSNVWIGSENGRRDYYKHRSQGHFQPKNIRFSDGYSILLTHDGPGRILSMTDNKGQHAYFTYEQNVVSNSSKWMLKYVDIDTDYDGTTLNAEYRISYFYDENSFEPDIPLLARVDFTDNANSVTETTAEYVYDSVNYPPRLLEIRDGRLDANGQEFPYTTITYHPQRDSDKAEVASSQHHGGADGYTFGLSTSTTSSATNSLGRTTNFTFAEVGIQTKLTQLDGLATTNCLPVGKSFDYTPGTGEPEGYLYSKVEKNGSVTNYTRDTRGLVLTKTEDANGVSPRVTSYTWHATLRLPLTRTTTEMVETFTYNVGTDGEVQLATYSQTDNLLASPTYNQIRTWTYSYTTLASDVIVLSSVDGPGLLANGVTDVTSYDYDTDGNLTKITDPNGLVTEMLTLNKMGQPTLLKAPNNLQWSFEYDHRGRVTKSILNRNGAPYQTATYTYDVIGQMLSYTDFLNRTTSFEYDEARRLVKTTNPLGETAEFEYDLMGNLTRTEYSTSGAVNTFWDEIEYDELGRLLKTVGAMGQEWEFSHDVEDNLDSITDPDTLQITQSFDALNRLTDVVDRASQTTSMEHNDADQVTEYTDPRGIDTDFTYNGFGEVLTEVSADRGTLSYSYDTRGLVTSMTDGNGVVTSYGYDDGGRVTAKSFPSDSSLDQTFQYSTHLPNRPFLSYDGPGYSKMLFDGKHGLPVHYRSKIDAVTYNMNGKINANGEPTRFYYPSGLQIDYNRDTLGQITRIRIKAVLPKQTVVSGVTYLPNGGVSSLSFPEGSVHTASYDLSYRLTGLQDTLLGTSLRDVTYGWTSRDNLASVTNALDPLDNRLFDYTSREKLEDADGPWGELDYTYDGVGNRLTRLLTASGTTTTDTYSNPATSNRLQSVAGGQTRAFTYDAAGNVTYDARSGVGYGYTYDAANRMESFSISGVVQAEYEYNSLGQQVIRRLTQTGQTIHNVFDMNGNRMAEYDYDDVAGTSTLIREYIWMNGQVIAVVEAGEVYYVRSDHIGRPVFATDIAGTVVWEASYLPFGGVHSSSGANINLRFPGQWFQAEAGLHQNWMRDYDPTLGRYIQADPLGLVDGASVYNYALQNPGRYIDPTGELIPVAGVAGRAAVACWRNPACRAGAAGALSMLLGWMTDEDCYTFSEAIWDFGIGAAIGGVSRPFVKGTEYGIKGGRIAPYGNRWWFPGKNGSKGGWNKSNGKWPHYHNPRYDAKGNVRPGQGKGRHRPWDRSPIDKSFWDRF